MNRKKGFSITKGKGFYAALLLCIVGVIVASFAAINGLVGGDEKTIPQQQDTTQEDETTWGLDDFISDPVEKPQEQVPVSPSQSSALQNGDYSSGLQQNSADVQNEPSELPAASATRFERPTEGEVINKFSGDELVFNTTMQDWRTHNGTDYKAAVGTAVNAIMDGTVIAVEKGTVWGNVVRVQHGEYVVSYMGLADDIKVKKDVNIVVGETIGKVGEISSEIALEPHLHVEIEQNGKLIDAESLFA